MNSFIKIKKFKFQANTYLFKAKFFKKTLFLINKFDFFNVKTSFYYILIK